MAATSAAGGRFYRPELDVVRFLAFFLVFLHHTLPEGNDPRISRVFGGYSAHLYDVTEAFRFGLSLFFTLSAFLIFELLLRERQAAGTVSVKQFYIRRILRIWPLYYFALALGAVVALLPGGDHGEIGKMGWYAFFAAAWYLALHATIDNPVQPLWSISVEEQFYILAPWVTKYLRPKFLYGLCIVLIVASNGWLLYLGNERVSSHRIWYDTFVQFECFAAGILLGLVLHGRVPKIVLGLRLLLVVGALSLWVLAVYPLHIRYDNDLSQGTWNLMAGYALAALGSVLILVAFLGLNPKLLPGWAIYFGRISFGLYVYHEFAIYFTKHFLIGHLTSVECPLVVLKAGLEFGLTVLMAAISYRYFETPFLKLKKRHTIVQNEPISNAG